MRGFSGRVCCVVGSYTLGWVWVGMQLVGCVVSGLKKGDLGRKLDRIRTSTIVFSEGWSM